MMQIVKGQSPKSLWKNLALVTGGLLVALALSEALTRAVGVRPAILDPAMFVVNPDSMVPYKLRPNYVGRYAGGLVTIDMMGDRKVRPRVAPPAAGGAGPRKTVLLLGDSQVFGQGLDDSQTLASQLQDSLSVRGIGIRVANVAVPGYNSWNEYAALRDYLDRREPDHVLLSYIPNDPTFDNDFFGLARGEFDGVSRSPLHRFTRMLYGKLHSAYLLSEVWRLVRQTGTRDLPQTVPSDSAVEHSMQAVSRMSQLCRERGITFAVGLYRDVSIYRAPEETLRYEAKITRALAARGLNWFWLSSHTQRLGRNEATVSWNDPHPSARATALIVSDILRNLPPALVAAGAGTVTPDSTAGGPSSARRVR